MIYVEPKIIKEFAAEIKTREDSKEALSDDIKASYAAAKVKGIEPKALKQALKYLRMDREVRETYDEKVQQYLNILEGK